MLKKSDKSIYIFLFNLFLLNTIFAGELQEKPITFAWALLYKEANISVQQLDFNSTKLVFSANTELKILFKPLEETYSYLFYSENSCNVLPLFPNPVRYLDTDYTEDFVYYIPDNSIVDTKCWFGLKQTGEEQQLILVVSTKRLKDLEHCMRTFQQAQAKYKPDDDRFKQTEKGLFDQVGRYIKVFNVFTDDAGKGLLIPNPFMGGIRTDAAEDWESFLQTVTVPLKNSGNKEYFYVKTINLVYKQNQ